MLVVRLSIPQTVDGKNPAPVLYDSPYTPEHNIVSLYIATKMIQKHAPHPCAILSTGGGEAKTEIDAGFPPSTVQKINMLAYAFVKVFLPSSDCSLV